MSGETASAPTPDPGIADAAAKQAALGEQYLQFAKDQFKVSTDRQTELDALTKQVQQQQLSAATQQQGYATEDRDRYNTLYKPVEDKFVADATSYATPERQEEAAAEAKGDVQNAAAAARGASERSAMSLGIRPDSGRFAGISRAGELGTALATAGAANTARQGVRDKGLALEGQVANLGRGLPVQANAETTAAASLGSNAVGLGQSNQNLSNSATGIVGAGYQGAQTGYGAQSAALGNLYNANMSSWNAQQQIDAQNMSGVTSAIGLGAGLIFSSKKLKTDKKPLPDGKALEAVKAMPVENWRYKPGVQDGGETEHTGPYAEDMQAATGQGDGMTIQLQDEIGLTLKAVQDLAKRVDRIDKAVGIGKASAPVAKAKSAAVDRPAAKPPATAPTRPGSRPAAVGLGLKRAA